MRTAALFAAACLTTLASCSEQDVATMPTAVKARPSFTTYTASAGAGVILGPWNTSNYTIAYGINDIGAITGVSDISNAVADACLNCHQVYRDRRRPGVDAIDPSNKAYRCMK